MQNKFKIVTFDWGLDLSRSAQGAGGVGGLLATRTSEFASSRYTTSSRRIGQHFPSYDANGNIIAWTSEGGEHRTTRDFDAFGNIVTKQGERWNESTPFGFSTKYEDVESGLLYYGYRHYDPTHGRWLNRDPIGEEGGTSLYGMVGNDAVRSRDYLGLDRQTENFSSTSDIAGATAVSGYVETVRLHLEKGNEVEAARNAQHLYNLLSNGLTYKNFPFAKKMMKRWLAGGGSNYALTQSEVKQYLNDKTAKEIFFDEMKNLATEDPNFFEKSINTKVVLAQTENTDMYYGMNRAHVGFIGCVSKGSGGETVKATGQWYISDQYDWNAGEGVTVLGIWVPDSYGLLVEKHLGAKGFRITSFTRISISSEK